MEAVDIYLHVLTLLFSFMLQLFPSGLRAPVPIGQTREPVWT